MHPNVIETAARRAARRGLLPLAAGLALAGCSSTGGPMAWRVEPAYAVTAGGPSVGSGYASLARVYESEGRLEQALAAWQRAVAADPANPDLHTAAGVAMARSRQLGQAIDQFRLAVELQSDNARALNNLGYALILDGQDDEAAKVLGQALAADPAHVMARANLAAVEQRLALRLARELAEGALAAAPAPQALGAAAPEPAAAAPVATETVATAAVAAPPVAAPPADDVPDKVMAMLRGQLPAAVLAPLNVQTAPSVAALQVSDQPMESARVPAPSPVISHAASPAPTAAEPRPLRWDARVSIVNGNGVNGAAARVRRLLQDDGLATARLQNLLPYDQPRTIVQYRPGRAEQADRIARRIPAGAATQEVASLDAATDLRVVLGHDRKATLAACVARGECAGALAVVADAGMR